MNRSSISAFSAGLFSVLIVRAYNPSIYLGGVWSHFNPPNSPSPPRSSSSSSTLCSTDAWKTDFLYKASPENLGRGLHYLCVTPASSSSGGVSITPYIDAAESYPPLPAFDAQTSDELMMHLSRLVATRPDEGRDFKLFDSEGNELFTESQLKKGSSSDMVSTLSSASLVLLFEGGSFIWPGVKVGHRRTVSVGENESLIIRTLALRPLLLTVEEQVRRASMGHRCQSPELPYATPCYLYLVRFMLLTSLIAVMLL